MLLNSGNTSMNRLLTMDQVCSRWLTLGS